MTVGEMDVVWDVDEQSDEIPTVFLRTEVTVTATAEVDWGVVMDDDLIVGPSADSPVAAMTHLLATEWDWHNLRDYVVAKVVERHGPFPRNPVKEAAIFRSFVDRWGPEKAQKIARVAFEVHDGMWRGSPIRVERFSKSSDTYFAAVLLADD